MNKKVFTYKKSGVDIKAADKFVNFISKISTKKRGKKKFNNIGGFGSITNIPKGIKNPKIVACTDGVGTKIEIANTLRKFNTIGIDLVAMSVNDLIVQGAKPLFFLDYISINKIDLPKLKSIVKGILKGCKLAGCELVGGETAEMPDTYEINKFDIAGFAVGIVDQKKILDKKKIKKNDLILAVPSSGLHSNGYSLIRYLINDKKINIKKSKFLKSELLKPTKIYVKEILKLLDKNLINHKKINIKKNKFLKSELLKPTKIYVKEILRLLDKNLINGCSNITGGGLSDNLKRVMPDNLTADIDLNKIKTKEIFRWLKKNGISNKEMLKTFNCGVGFCIIIEPKNLKKITKYFSKEYKPYVIGKILPGKNKVKLNGSINWFK